MERPQDRPQLAAEQALHSLRVVMSRMADLLWKADAKGKVTEITLCRPSSAACDGMLDDLEVAQIEQLWHKSVKCAERFTARYHVGGAGATKPRAFLVEAIPVLDARDDVCYWWGSASEVDGDADSTTRFLSEVAAVLSSSLNSGTIVNRLVQTSVDYFCSLCAVFGLDEDGTLGIQGFADRRAEASDDRDALQEAAAEAVLTRQPALLPSGSLGNAGRSGIVAPLLVGTTCIGALCFVESKRPTNFTASDLEVAIVVARQLGMALENIKAFEREQNITERFRFLARTSERLFATLDSVKMLQLLLDTLRDIFPAYAIAVGFEEGRLRVVAASGTDLLPLRRDAEREMITLLQDRRSILFGAQMNIRRLKSGPLEDTPAPRSWMMAPLFVRDELYGAIICCTNERTFDRSDLELLEEIGRRASLALEHARSFERERRLAHTLQQATLPTQLASVANASLSFVYRPAASEVQVGGDWYDAFEIDDHRVLLTVGDVTGHGLQASIVMGKLRHAINVVAMYESNPVLILDAAERIVQRRYPGSVATAFVALLDSRDDTLTYANAGHPYPLLRLGNGSTKELEADGLPIGLRSVGGPVSPMKQRLESARLLAFYTDGLTEATRNALEGERLLHQAVDSDAILYVDSPAEFIETYCLRSQSPDDVAILALNFVKSARWKFDSSNCRAARRARRDFLEQLEAIGAPQGDFKAAELIFGELAANVAQHAAGVLEIALEWRAERAVLHMIDRGRGYAGCHRNDNDLFKEHGRGLWLVQRLGAELEIEILPGYGTHIQATLPIRRA